MCNPGAVALDSSGILNLILILSCIFLFFLFQGNVYISDTYNNRIRKVTVTTGIITSVAGSSTVAVVSGDNGPATSAGLYYPIGLDLDSSGCMESF